MRQTLPVARLRSSAGTGDRRTLSLLQASLLVLAMGVAASARAQTFSCTYSKPSVTQIHLDPAEINVGEPVAINVIAATCPARVSCDTSTPGPTCVNGNFVGTGSCVYEYDSCYAGGLDMDPGDGTCNQAINPFCLGPSAFHSFRNIGPYTIRARARNHLGTSTIFELTVSPKEVRPPTASLSIDINQPSSTQIAGSPIQFNSDGTTGGVRSYAWDFGDGKTSTEANPKHVFAAADDYVVTLTVTNKIGSSTAQLQVSVRPKSGGSPPASANFSFSPVSPVTGQSVQFVDKSTGSILRWRWNFEGTIGSTRLIGAPLSYEQNPTYIFQTASRKNVELWVSNEFGSTGKILFVDVLRNDVPPLASFSFTPFSVTVGVPVQFTDESFGATSWVWEFGEDGATGTQQNPTYTYRTEGQKAVTLRVANAFGSHSVTKFFACHASATRLEALFTWTPSNPRPGEEVSFIDLSTGGPERWIWTVSDGSSNSTQNWTHRFAAEGDYIVGLRVEKGTAVHTLGQQVKVRNGDAPVARFIWSPVQPAVGEEVRFENQSQNAATYLWQFDDGSTSTSTNPAHTYTFARTYNVMLTARSASGAEHTTTVPVVVGAQESIPVASFEVTPNPAKVGEPVKFTDRSTGRPTRWLWTFGHSGATSTQQNPTFTFTTAGTYTVTLVAENSTGKSAERGVGVVVKASIKPVARFRFTPSSPKIGQTITFTDESANDPTEWTWTFGDNATGSGRSVTHAFATGGRFNVTLKAANAEGSDSQTQDIFVGEDLVADFSFTPEKPIVGKPVRFTNQSSGSPDSLEWLIDGLSAGTAPTIDHTFLRDGTHRAELRVKRGSQSLIREKSFDVAGPPVARINVDGALYPGRPVTFFSASTGVITKYSWTISGTDGGHDRTATTTFTHTGDVVVTLKVENAAGTDSHTAKFTVFSEPATARPNITSVIGHYGPCYFAGSDDLEEFDVSVAWRDFTPRQVSTSLNGSFPEPFPMTGDKRTILFPTARLPILQSAAVSTSTLTFTATGEIQKGALRESKDSDPETRNLTVINYPEELRGNTRKTIFEPLRRGYVFGTSIPAREFEFAPTLPTEVPLLGGYRFGIVRTQYRNEDTFRTDCTAGASTQLEGGFTAAGGTIALKGFRTGGYQVSKQTGITLKPGSSFGFDFSGTLERRQTLGDLLGPASRVCSLPVIGSLCTAAEIKGFVGVSSAGEWTYKADPASPGQLVFSDNTATIKITGGCTAALNGGQAYALEVTGQLHGGLTIGPLLSPKPVFRGGEVVGEIGVKATTYIFATETKFVASCLYVSPAPGAEGGFSCGRVTSNGTGDVRSLSATTLSLLPRATGHEVKAEASGPVVLQNMSPLAHPVTAFRGEEAVAVYLADNAGVANSVNRFDVRSVRRDGSGAWSAPRSISNDSLGEFNPAVLFRDADHVVAMWERNRNAALTPDDLKSADDLAKLTREMEIVTATLDLRADRWSEPEALTSNAVYDFGPRIAALADGRVIAVWVRQDASGDQQVISRMTNSAGTTWGAETIVAGKVRGVSRLSIAASGNEATLVYGRDGDGSGATAGDTEIGSARFRSGAWESARDLTTDTIADLLPQVIYAGNVARVIWARGGNLVWQTASGGPVETIRTSDVSLGVLDASAIVSPLGQVALVRSDLSGGKPSIVAQIWDPGSGRWSSDLTLTSASGALQDVAAAFRGTDAIRFTMIGAGNEGATPRFDFIADERELRVDVAALTGSTASAPAHPAAGERTTLSAMFANQGELVLHNVSFQLFGGNAASASPLAAATIAESWLPGEQKRVEFQFDRPTATPVVTIVADPERQLSESSVANNTVRHAFENLAPVACFQVSALSGVAPLDISADASCSSDAEGAITAYSWTIDGGASVSSLATAKHRFDKPGSYPVTLTVTDEMGARSSRTVNADVVAPSRRPPEQVDSLYLAVAGRAPGLGGSYFVSDLDILNTNADDIELNAVYLPAARGDTYSQKLTLRGGELLRTRDVVAGLFSAVNGAGSIRLDAARSSIVAVARTYNDQPSGTSGFSNEAVRSSAALHDGESGVILQHWLPGYRTNIGFAEISGQQTVVTVTAYDEKGVVIGTRQFSVGPYQQSQINGAPEFQHRGRIVIAVSGGSVLAYVSTIDGQTGDPIYQVPEREGASGGSELLIPIVARLNGSNNSVWRSDVRIYNSGAAQSATIELHTASATQSATVSIDAGETLGFDDVVARLFPQLGSAGGALRIHAAAPLLASSRTFNLTAQGTYGLYVPARRSADLIGPGETVYLVHIQENSRYRANFGMTSFDTAGAVLVRAFDRLGNTLATKEYGVAAGKNMQVGSVLADMGVALPVDVAGLEVRVLQGRLFIYASINDNRTGDGTLVEASR